MTTWLDARKNLENQLTGIYDASEARSITKLIFTDYFQLTESNKREDISEIPLFEMQLEDVIKRLLASEPVQYVIGSTWFYGLKLKVNASVLIPRPETEELVEWILEDNSTQNTSILDIGTGSGCIPCALKFKKPNWQVSAFDVSEAALITASRNAYRNNIDVDFFIGDVLKPESVSEQKKYDIIVSNPPYIPNTDACFMHPNVLNHEPHLALFVENNDTLQFYRAIAAFGMKHLNPKGKLYVESHFRFVDEVAEYFKSVGYENVETKKDLSGHPRMVSGIRSRD